MYANKNTKTLVYLLCSEELCLTTKNLLDGLRYTHSLNLSPIRVKAPM